MRARLPAPELVIEPAIASSRDGQQGRHAHHARARVPAGPAFTAARRLSAAAARHGRRELVLRLWALRSIWLRYNPAAACRIGCRVRAELIFWAPMSSAAICSAGSSSGRDVAVQAGVVAVGIAMIGGVLLGLSRATSGDGSTTPCRVWSRGCRRSRWCFWPSSSPRCWGHRSARYHRHRRRLDPRLRAYHPRRGVADEGGSSSSRPHG